MIYRAHSKDNKLFIAMYETEEPKREKFLNKTAFDYAHYTWQSSKREYKVRDEDKEAIKALLFEEYDKQPKQHILVDSYVDFVCDLNKGIDCTFLKDRLELVNDNKVINGVQAKLWTLKPIEKGEDKNEALEFAEWLQEQPYTYHLIAKKWYHKDYNDDWKTTEELYEIWKTTNGMMV